MNRCFVEENNGTTYEDKRAVEIINILDQSDYLLDIHNTISETSSIPFLISEHQELGKYFNVKRIVSGFDILHPGGSDGYMNKQLDGSIGICLESGSINYGNPDVCLNLIRESVFNFLKFTGNIKGKPIE